MLFKRSIRTQVLTSIGASLLLVMLSVPLCVYFFTNVLSEPTWFTGVLALLAVGGLAWLLALRLFNRVLFGPLGHLLECGAQVTGGGGVRRSARLPLAGGGGGSIGQFTSR